MGIVALNLVVKIFVINSSSKVLLLKRSSNDKLYPLEWDLPGGSTELNENPNLAIIRELKEETHLAVDNVYVLYVATEYNPIFTITLIYHVKLSNNKVLLSHEHEKYKWAKINEIKELGMALKYQEAIKLLNV